MPVNIESLEVTRRWKAHRAQWKTCLKCRLGECAKFHVLADGDLPADVVFIGEGPGKTEDATGVPFSGKAGKLLREWIASAQRAGDERNSEDFRWCISNLVACRPCDGAGTANRTPFEDEVKACDSRVVELLELASPKALVLVGQSAQNQCPEPEGIAILFLPHPAWVLRQGGSGSKEDSKCVVRLIAFLQNEGIV